MRIRPFICRTPCWWWKGPVTISPEALRKNCSICWLTQVYVSLERYTVSCSCSSGFGKNCGSQVLKIQQLPQQPDGPLHVTWVVASPVFARLVGLAKLFLVLILHAVLNEIWFHDSFKGFLKLQTRLHLDFMHFIFSKIIQEKKRVSWQNTGM